MLTFVLKQHEGISLRDQRRINFYKLELDSSGGRTAQSMEWTDSGMAGHVLSLSKVEELTHLTVSTLPFTPWDIHSPREDFCGRFLWKKTDR